MLSFNNDQEFFNWLISVDFREGQFSENEFLYMLKRFREEFRKMEGRKKSIENDLFNQQKKNELLELTIDKMKNDMHFIDCKNQVLLNRFKNGLTFWERITGKVRFKK